MHSDLSDNTASAGGELDEGKTTQLVQSNLQLSPRLQTNEGPDEGPQHSQEHADLGRPTPDCEESYSTDWERPPSSPVLIDERQGSQNLEDAQPQGTNFTVKEIIDVNTANEQLAVEHLSAHLGSGTDYKIEFKSQLHAADHWREAIGLEEPVVANSQELFSSSTTELDPASSERSGCQKETPYQEELTTVQNPTATNQSRRANLAAQEAGATDNQTFFPAGGREQNHRWSQPLHAGQPNSGQLPDGRNMSLSRWATLKGTQSECRREEKQEQERVIMWNQQSEAGYHSVGNAKPLN